MSNAPHFGARKSTGGPQIDKLRAHHGTAAPEPGQGARVPQTGGSPSLNGPGNGKTGTGTASLDGQGQGED